MRVPATRAVLGTFLKSPVGMKALDRLPPPLRDWVLRDPIMVALFDHTIAWADIPTEVNLEDLNLKRETPAIESQSP